MGLARIVEIDTTGGPAFGFEHFKQYDFLRDKEVVLTFDDGPWPENTPAVLKALTDKCVKGDVLRDRRARDLASGDYQDGGRGRHDGRQPHLVAQGSGAETRTPRISSRPRQEIEMGVSAVHMAVGGPIAPFFRFPALQQPAELMAYLGTRNIAIFSTDIDTFDFKMHKPEDVVKSVMTKLDKHGKGIMLMHDFQQRTAEAMPELLRQLKAGGYKIVHMVPKQPVTTLPKYDDMVRAQDKFSRQQHAAGGERRPDDQRVSRHSGAAPKAPNPESIVTVVSEQRCCRDSSSASVIMDSGLALRAPRNDG